MQGVAKGSKGTRKIADPVFYQDQVPVIGG